MSITTSVFKVDVVSLVSVRNFFLPEDTLIALPEILIVVRVF